jgi:hypothetical protein
MTDDSLELFPDGWASQIADLDVDRRWALRLTLAALHGGLQPA